MTRAPSNLLAVRSLLLTHLNVDPDTSRDADLEPAEVGIVGNAAHRGGYHCGSDRLDSDDYSLRESPRDRAGLTLDAAALDVGGFEVRSGGRTNTLAGFSNWLAAQCEANTRDTRDIREVIYSPDGRTVKRWDRLGKRSSGDDSHRWHTHISFFRDAIKAGRDQRPLFRRYLTYIGLLEDDMANFTDKHAATLDRLADLLPTLASQAAYTDARVEAMASGRAAVRADLLGGGSPVWTVQAIRALVDGLGQIDEQVAAQLRADLARIEAQIAEAGDPDPAAIAAAIPPELARQVADELAARMAS